MSERKREIRPTKEYFTIHDSKGETYFTPFACRNQVDAVRQFASMVNDPKLQFNQFPKEFSLCKVAEWFDDGEMRCYESPVFVVGAENLLSKEKKNG